MNKPELIGLALDQLLEQFTDSGADSFDFTDAHYPDNPISRSYAHAAILWEPRIEVGGTNIEDPNNYKSMVITFNHNNNEMACYIFNRHNLTSTSKGMSKYDAGIADASIKYTRLFEKYRGNYKKFKKLRDMIMQRDKRKENKEFLRKLYNVFPGTGDKNLFGQ